MELSNETKVKEIALLHPGARQILEDAGVDYCCGGGKSLHEACLHAKVAAEEILKRLRENKIQAGLDENVWISSPLRDLTRHVRVAETAYAQPPREAVTHAMQRKLPLRFRTWLALDLIFLGTTRGASYEINFLDVTGVSRESINDLLPRAGCSSKMEPQCKEN
jgi:hypothetical protein